MAVYFKDMNLGNASTTVNVIANGNVVGANIKSKGSASQPVYFDANGVAQACTDCKVEDITQADINALF